MDPARAEELGDDDILEVIEPPLRSGSYTAVRERSPSPPPRVSQIRRMLDTIPEESPTGVSDLVTVLARLSRSSSVAKIHRPRADAHHVPAAEFILSLVEANMTVGAIANESPLGDERTMRVLADLITSGEITLLE
jgi:hypothetical protein